MIFVKKNKILTRVMIIINFNFFYNKTDRIEFQIKEGQKIEANYNESILSKNNINNYIDTWIHLNNTFWNKPEVEKITTHISFYKYMYAICFIYYYIASYLNKKANKIINNDFYIFCQHDKEETLEHHLTLIKSSITFNFIVNMKKYKTDTLFFYSYKYIFFPFMLIPLMHRDLKAILLDIHIIYDNINYISNYLKPL